MAERKQAPVSTPVEPRTRRGRRKLDDVQVGTAAARAKFDEQQRQEAVRRRSKTAALTEQEKQDALKAKQRAARWKRVKARASSAVQVGMVVGPITAPMVIAWTGQSGFAMKVLGWNFIASLLYAAAYELTTVFAAWMYHEAKKDGDKGWEYRIATWTFAAGAGVQQWWHYSKDWQATPRAVTYSTMTIVGVLVWELYARLIHRRALRAAGKLIGARPRIGLARWFRYPLISWTAWSGSVRHGFSDLDSMWTWAEIESDRRRTERNKMKDLKSRLKEANTRIAELEGSTPDRKQSVRIERTDQAGPELPPADPEPVEAGPAVANSGPHPDQKALPPAASVADPGSQQDTFEPTDAERQAVAEMVEAGITLNRTEVAGFVRDNRERLGQDGISTKRAAQVAAWGRQHNQNGLRSVG